MSKSYLKDLAIEPECIGFTNAFHTNATECNGMRQDMGGKSITSCQVVSGAEFPHMFTGYEQMVKKYIYDSSRRNHDVRILNVINKFNIRMDQQSFGNNPTRTVIYQDLDTREIGYFNINRYVMLSQGFGYLNEMHQYNLTKGTVLTPEDSLSASPSIKDGLYCMGVNANVAFMTREATVEDAQIISKSFAKKLAPTAVEKVTLIYDLKKFPLNINGDDQVYKVIPDLGSKVRQDGIIAAFRRVSELSAISDLTPDRLRKCQYMFDDVIHSLPDGHVVDIDVYMNPIPKSVRIPEGVYDQLFGYHETSMEYYQKIMDTWLENKNKGDLTPKFSTLVTVAMSRLLVHGRKVPEMKRSSNRLMYNSAEYPIVVDITIAKETPLNKGFKISNGYGNKGVLVKIADDDELGKDEQGFQVDMVVDPISTLKRTNVAQIKIQYINRISKWVSMLLNDKHPADRFNHIIDYMNIINPYQVKHVLKVCNTDRKKDRYVTECMKDTIHLWHPTSYKRITDEMLIELTEKYQVPISPITFNVVNKDGVKRQITTKVPVCVGSQYIYLLHKQPKPLGPAFAYVNKIHFPSGNKKFGVHAPVSNTPQKVGEAEHRMLIVAGCGEDIARMRCLYGNSTKGPMATITSILNARQPSKIRRMDIATPELRDSESSLHSLNNMVNTLGVDLQHVLIDKNVAEERFKYLNEKRTK